MSHTQPIFETSEHYQGKKESVHDWLLPQPFADALGLGHSSLEAPARDLVLGVINMNAVERHIFQGGVMHHIC